MSVVVVVLVVVTVAIVATIYLSKDCRSDGSWLGYQTACIGSGACWKDESCEEKRRTARSTVLCCMHATVVEA